MKTYSCTIKFKKDIDCNYCPVCNKTHGICKLLNKNLVECSKACCNGVWLVHEDCPLVEIKDNDL